MEHAVREVAERVVVQAADQALAPEQRGHEGGFVCEREVIGFVCER